MYHKSASKCQRGKSRGGADDREKRMWTEWAGKLSEEVTIKMRPERDVGCSLAKCGGKTFQRQENAKEMTPRQVLHADFP